LSNPIMDGHGIFVPLFPLFEGEYLHAEGSKKDRIRPNQYSAKLTDLQKVRCSKRCGKNWKIDELGYPKIKG